MNSCCPFSFGPHLRFMHAAGTGTVVGAADIPGDITLEYTGEISLDAPEPPAE